MKPGKGLLLDYRSSEKGFLWGSTFVAGTRFGVEGLGGGVRCPTCRSHFEAPVDLSN